MVTINAPDNLGRVSPTNRKQYCSIHCMEYPETGIFGRMESALSLLLVRVAFREKTSLTQIQSCKQVTGREVTGHRGDRRFDSIRTRIQRKHTIRRLKLFIIYSEKPVDRQL